MAILGSIASLFGVGCKKKAAPSAPSSSSAGPDLRMMVLTNNPSTIGIHPTAEFSKVYGVVMDWPVEEAIATVVSLSDGTASLYTTSTFGIIGGIGHESVRAAAVKFVASAARHFDDAVPTTDLSYPQTGLPRFYLLGFDGVRSIDIRDHENKRDADKFRGLFDNGQRVVTELRRITEKDQKAQ